MARSTPPTSRRRQKRSTPPSSRKHYGRHDPRRTGVGQGIALSWPAPPPPLQPAVPSRQDCPRGDGLRSDPDPACADLDSDRDLGVPVVRALERARFFRHSSGRPCELCVCVQGLSALLAGTPAQRALAGLSCGDRNAPWTAPGDPARPEHPRNPHLPEHFLRPGDAVPRADRSDLAAVLLPEQRPAQLSLGNFGHTTGGGLVW